MKNPFIIGKQYILQGYENNPHLYDSFVKNKGFKFIDCNAKIIYIAREDFPLLKFTRIVVKKVKSPKWLESNQG